MLIWSMFSFLVMFNFDIFPPKMPRESLVCAICNSNSFYSFIFKTLHDDCWRYVPPILCTFDNILGLLNLDIIMFAPPLVCLRCVICNSNSYHFYLFKPCIPNSDILNMCNSFYCAALIYIFRTFFLMLNLDIFTPSTHRFTSTTLMMMPGLYNM